jgi:2,3-bisphosphoglycerate-dependent phosphoglycerate mutase
MRFFYIRHGQSINNAIFDATGLRHGRSADPGLTVVGKQQAHLLAAFVRAKDAEAGGNERAIKRDYFGFTHLYTSLTIRSVQTGTAISADLKIPLIAWPEIFETGGIYLEDPASGELHGLPGKTRSFFQRNYRRLILPESLTDEGWWNRPYETEEEWLPRAKKVLQTLLEQHGNTDDRVAIISHGGFYMQLMRAIFGIKGEKIGFSIFNTGVSCIDFSPDGSVELVYHNRTDHLPDRLLT